MENDEDMTDGSLPDGLAIREGLVIGDASLTTQTINQQYAEPRRSLKIKILKWRMRDGRLQYKVEVREYQRQPTYTWCNEDNLRLQKLIPAFEAVEEY